MFLVYINKLSAILECYGIKIKLFADNAKLYVQIVNELNVVRLQQAIDECRLGSRQWKSQEGSRHSNGCSFPCFGQFYVLKRFSMSGNK